MRNVWRLLAFDIAAPLAAIGALLAIGLVLGWPLWWVSACSVLLLLIVEGMGVNFWLLRRDSVSVGTDDDAPGLRLAVVFLCAAALCVAVLTGYTHWTRPDRDFKNDSRQVVQVAAGMAEAMASFTPSAPTNSIDRAAAHDGARSRRAPSGSNTKSPAPSWPSTTSRRRPPRWRPGSRRSARRRPAWR